MNGRPVLAGLLLAWSSVAADGGGVVAALLAPRRAVAQEPASTAPTVGDTVWLERAVNVGAGLSVRPRPIPPSELLDPLAPPHVVVRERDQVIRYPVVFWRAGLHAVEIPGPILVRPDGWSDTLRAAVARVQVASVLPDQPVDSIPPRPPEAALPMVTRSVLPALLLCLIGAVALLPLHFWWRRRGPAAAPSGAAVARPTPEQLDGWLAAGELRAALEGWSQLLRAGVGESPEREALLDALAGARYGPLDRERADELAARARRWLGEGKPA